MGKYLVTLLSLMVYLFVFLTQPLYASSIRSGGKVNSSANESSNAKGLTASRLTQLAQTASSSNSFQSQASNGQLAASVSVDPATLSLSFNEQVVDIHSDALSGLSFPLSITNKSYGGYNQISSLGLYFNIPVIKLKQSIDDKWYYDLYLNGSSNAFEIDVGQNNVDRSLSFYYSKLHHYHLSFTDDNTIVYTDGVGTRYIFDKVDDGSAYRCRAIIDNRGYKITFSYGTDNSIQIANNDGKVMANLQRYAGLTLIDYTDLMGTSQNFMVIDSAASAALVDALGQQVTLQYSDDDLTNITLPNTVEYQVKYSKLKKLQYTTWDGSNINSSREHEVNYDSDYVSELTKVFHNSQTANQVFHYSIDSEGNNFAGNHMWCLDSTYDKLNKLEDWLIECGISSENKNYGYSTTVKHGDLEVVRSYNYLHLLTGTTTKLNAQVISEQSTTFKDEIAGSDRTKATFSSLSSSYNQPSEVYNYVYDFYHLALDPKIFQTDYQYYSQADESESGFSLGQLKSMTDPMGNTQQVEYYPESNEAHYHAPIQRQSSVRLYGVNGAPEISSVTKYNKLSWLSRDVKVNGKSYSAKLPVFQNMSLSMNGKALAEKDNTVVSKPTDPLYNLMYGLSSTTRESINGSSNPYVESKTLIEKDEANNQYQVQESEVALSDEHNDKQAPTELTGTKKIFNQYGALVETIDPVTKDIVRYDHYDALGRLTELSYIPGGNDSDTQRYKFAYALDSQAGEAGYIVTKTVVTPTTGAEGYSSISYYNQNGQLTKLREQNSDRSGYYLSETRSYNNLGQLSESTVYYYDPEGNGHPEVTGYLYDQKGSLIGTTNPDGSANISISYNDIANNQDSGNTEDNGYRHITLSYLLEPTGNKPSTNTDSTLCQTVDSAGNSAASSCKVAHVNIEEAVYQPTIDKYTAKRIWQHPYNYSYSLIMDPDFTYTDKTGAKKNLYTSDEQSTLVALNKKLASGEMYDVNALTAFAGAIRKTCLSDASSCAAGSFVKTTLDSLGQPLEEEDVVNGTMSKDYYDSDKPYQLNASTLSIRKDNGDVSAVKTLEYHYDQYDNVNAVYTYKGAYDLNKPASEKTFVGGKTYSALGFLLNQTVMVNDKADKLVFHYDTTTGLPISITDPLGNEAKFHYDDSIWKSKVSSIDYYNQSKAKDFTLSYTYDPNGDLKATKKVLADNTLVSETHYTYDPVTLDLLSTEVSHAGSDKRKEVLSYTNQGTLKSRSYQRANQEVYQESYQANTLGLPTAIRYTGNKEFNLGFEYNADLSLKQNNYDDNKAQSYRYDSLGRLSSLDNYKDNKVIRHYGYEYDRLGYQSQKTSQIESNNEATTEHYGYSQLGQLTSYRCAGAQCPQNGLGKSISESTYQYDDLFNKLTNITQMIQGESNKQVTSYHYESQKNQDPTQVTEIDYGNGQKTSLSYDQNGNVKTLNKVTQKGAEHYQLGYDADQEMTTVKTDSQEIHYQYDEDGQRIEERHYDNNGKDERLDQYYFGGSLKEQSVNNEIRHYVANGSLYQGKYQQDLTDGYHLTGSINEDNTIEGNYVYDPFGVKSDLFAKEEKLALSVQKSNLAYRMMNTDTLTHWQGLGNGYRDYDPALGIFLKHDSYSPFGRGGINGYAYADNNPVNAFDPTGHEARGGGGSNGKVAAEQHAALDYSRAMTTGAILGLAAGIFVGLLFPAGVSWGWIAFWAVVGAVVSAVVTVAIQVAYTHQNFIDTFFREDTLVGIAMDIGMQILITGVIGFLGNRIAKFVKIKNPVRALERETTPVLHEYDVNHVNRKKISIQEAVRQSTEESTVVKKNTLSFSESGSSEQIYNNEAHHIPTNNNNHEATVSVTNPKSEGSVVRDQRSKVDKINSKHKRSINQNSVKQAIGKNDLEKERMNTVFNKLQAKEARKKSLENKAKRDQE
ncbi:RHS repeat domain-containing protein [Fangia hongkongensis]|uniref:RHS repeat domain-containing protein n=1 Tax=Fangia hongkongensis TaxID=270495 RepID=UPI000361EFBD|nr:RHS repeat-associated core domain-containing protein [Fangia hongkongensis]MBK2124860.1 RHS repeat-associated core domain-containing protein [Fangia hongkongensis]